MQDGTSLFAIAALAVYFLPWIIAACRQHPQRLAIVLINVFLGWTLIGWLVALVWAFISNRTDAPTPEPLERIPHA